MLRLRRKSRRFRAPDDEDDEQENTTGDELTDAEEDEDVDEVVVDEHAVVDADVHEGRAAADGHSHPTIRQITCRGSHHCARFTLFVPRRSPRSTHRRRCCLDRRHVQRRAPGLHLKKQLRNP